MPLPTITTSEYELVLPSNGKTVKYRPFLVKEEKILFMAMEGESSDEMTLAMKQIVNNCVQDKIDVDQLPLFDLGIRPR